MDRRVFLAHLAIAPMAVRQAIATPQATPSASPVAVPIAVVGEGKLKDAYGEDAFTIDVAFDGTSVTGELSMEVHMMETVIWQISANEFVSLAPLSAQSPHIKRLIGFATVNGGHDQAFILDLTDSQNDDDADAISLVLGQDALPFLGEHIKPGCDCGIGVSLRSEFIEGGITVTG